MANSAKRAIEIAESLVGKGIYVLGTGDCDTKDDGQYDCAGFAISKCYGLRRHRPGFNVGSWATVSDDINCNSAIEDSQHKREVFEQVLDHPKPGDLLTYPTFISQGKKFIGHVVLVHTVPAEWDWHLSRWAELGVIECRGPNGRKPGIIIGSASHFDVHDRTWPKEQHRSKLIRVRGA